MIRHSLTVYLCLVSFLFAQKEASEPTIPKSILEVMEWREVGPFRGGRCAAVTGLPSDGNTYYMGAAGGGVWKTEDAGASWRNISDGFFGGSIGAVAVAESDPNVIYVGGGEKTVRGNVSHGHGVWKSTDAGRTWVHMGLSDSRHVCRIRIHPRNPEILYAAVLGHLFGPNEERGVYRSMDGGKNWKRIHFTNEHAGAVDLVLDPTNPRILYAGFWRIRRQPWTLESGGEGSGIWKSTDSGDTWKNLTKNEGLPQGTIGICGITVSASNPDNLYAIIEAEKGGVFRSQDAGKTWKRTNRDRSLRQRAWYYSRLYADPQDEDTVYVLNVSFHRSKDGGKTFKTIRTPHGDNHDLWIDPQNPRRMIEGNDGGANVSTDGGKTWSRQDNQPTAQMYRVSTDNAFPYRLLGGQQDNSAIRIRSRSLSGGSIGIRDWDPTAGGESGHIVAKPDDPDIVFGGSYGGYLTMLNHRTGESRAVHVWPNNPMGAGAAELKYRFQWNFPIFFSPHDSNRLYAAGNILFASDDLGASWSAVSPDLTTNDKSKQQSSGGPITKDNTSVEYYSTIFAAVESPLVRGLLWTGSDDGLIHVSKDGGKNWTNVTPKELPAWSQINCIDAHPTEPGGLYVAATRYKSDDFAPYLFKTMDYGATWVRIDKGIDRSHFTRALRADPTSPGFLYAGTEEGVYFSANDGASWQSLQLKLPLVPITDLVVKENDLVVATQGRGYWILDDLTLFHQLTEDVASKVIHCFKPRPTIRTRSRRGSKKPVGAGQNPHAGVVFNYVLAEAPSDSKNLKLEIFDKSGKKIRTFSGKPKAGEKKDETKMPSTSEDLRQLPAKKGANRFAWNLNLAGPETFPGMILWAGGRSGPKVVPGTYSAIFTLGEESSRVVFQILPDPRSSATQEDLVAQFEFQLAIREQLTATHLAIRKIRGIRTTIASLKKKLKGEDSVGEILDLMKTLGEKTTAIEEKLYQTKNKSRQDPLNFPIRLNDKLAGVASTAARGDFAPTKQAMAVKEVLSAAIEAELSELSRILTELVPQLNMKIVERGIEAFKVSHTSVPE